MNGLIAHLGADVRKFWLRATQALNGFGITLGLILIYVHATYPQVEAQILGSLPPMLQGVVVVAFGALVHLTTRQAKKA